MDESREMYQEHILDLYKHPENYGVLKGATHMQRSFNPLCGDDITIQLIIKSGKIVDIKFTGSACALCTASASMITETAKEMNIAAIRKLTKDDITKMLRIPIGPVRLKCVLLPLEALHQALEVKQ